MLLVSIDGGERAPIAITPPPPPPDLVPKLKGQVNSAQDQFNRDEASLSSLQNNLSNALESQPNGGGKYRDDNGLQIASLQSEVDDAKKKVSADQIALNTARSNLLAARAVQQNADNYQPTAPQVTVHDDVTKALDPVLGKAQDDLHAASTDVTHDQSALNDTDSEIDQLNNTDAVGAAANSRLSFLEQKKGQEQKQLRSDQSRVDTDKATVAGVDVVRYSQQTNADLTVAKACFQTLHAQGILNDDGTLKKGVNLSTDQQYAYDRYVADLTKVGADNASLNNNYSQLQLYVSNPGKYGKSGTDAIDAVDHALAPVGLALHAPDVIDPHTAESNLSQSNSAVKYAVAAWNAAATLVKYDDATRKLAALKDQRPTNLAQLLPGAQLDVTQAGAASDQASTYALKLQFQQTVPVDDQAVTQARNDYSANRTSANWNALDEAQKKDAQDKYQLEVATAAFLAASGEVTASSQQLQHDTDIAEPAQQVASELSSSANLLSKGYALWQTQNVIPSGRGSPQLVSYNAGSQSPDVVANEELQLDVARYQAALSDFRLSLPSNLLNPQNAADQAALNARWNDFFSHQQAPLTDPNVARELQQLQPGQKVDIQAGYQEIQTDQAFEHKILADRSLLEQGWDWLSGGNSDTSGFLQGKLQALQELRSEQNGLSPAEFNTRYLAIMGNLSTQFGQQSDHQLDTSKSWATAEQIVEQVAAAATAITVTLATGGAGAGAGVAILAGTAAAFGTSQGFAAAQNAVTASEGGDVNDNSQVSLLAPITNNFGFGGDSWKEAGRAGVDAGVDAMTSFVSAAGVQGGGAVASAVATRVGALSIIKAISNDAVQSAVVSAVSGSAGMTVTQAIMGTGQVIATTGDVVYEESQGQITSSEGGKRIQSSVNGAVFNVVTAPLVGACSGVAPDGVVAQAGTNLATNAATTFAHNAIDGQQISSNDVLSVILNTLSATGMHELSTRSSSQIDPSVTPENSSTDNNPNPVTTDDAAQAPIDGPPEVPPAGTTPIEPQDIYSRASVAGAVYEVGPDTPAVIRDFLSRALSNNAYDSLEHLQLRARNYADLGDAEINLLSSALDELQRQDSPLVMQNSWLAHLERGMWGDNAVFGTQDRVHLGDEAAGLTDPTEGSPFYGSASRKTPLTQRKVQIPDELRGLLAMTLRGEYGPLTFDDAMQGLSLNSIGPMIASKLDSELANLRTRYWQAQRLKAERGDTGIAKSELGVELSQDLCSQILDALGLPVATGLSSTLADTVNLAKYAAEQHGTSWIAPGLTEEQAKLAMIDLGMIYMRQGAIPAAVARGINTLREELGLPPKSVSPERVFTHSYGEIHVGVQLAAQGGSATDPEAIGAAARAALQRLNGFRSPA